MGTLAILVSLTGTRSGFGRRCVQPGVLSDSLAGKAFREEHLIKGGSHSREDYIIWAAHKYPPLAPRVCS